MCRGTQTVGRSRPDRIRPAARRDHLAPTASRKPRPTHRPPPLSPRHDILSDAGGDPGCGYPDGVPRQMGVTRRRLDLRVAKQPLRSAAATRRAPAPWTQSCGGGHGCEHPQGPPLSPHPIPVTGKILQMRARLASRDDPGIVRRAGKSLREPSPPPATAEPRAGPFSNREAGSRSLPEWTSSQRNVRISLTRHPRQHQQTPTPPPQAPEPGPGFPSCSEPARGGGTPRASGTARASWSCT